MSKQVMQVCRDVTFKGLKTEYIKWDLDDWYSRKSEKDVSINDNVCSEVEISSSDASIEALFAKAELDKKLGGCNGHNNIDKCDYVTKGPARYTIKTRTSIFEDVGSSLKRALYFMGETVYFMGETEANSYPLW